MKKFRVGERVIANEGAKCYGITKPGWIGTVTESDSGDTHFWVNGKGSCTTKGFYVRKEYFDHLEEHKIVITTDGVETLARLYDGDKVIKSATAKCNPEDTFDFKVGAKLAYDRLMGEDKTESKSETKLDETFKFKVGDRVIVNDDLKTDEIGTIICIKADEKRYGVEFDRPGAGSHNCRGFSHRLPAGKEGTSGNCWWAGTKSLRLYEEPKKTFKYNTGAYVRIIDEKHGHEFKIGTIVRLTQRSTYYEATDSTGEYWYVEDDELAPIEWRVVNRAAKKGDYVRLLNNGFTFNAIGDILIVHKTISDEKILVLGKDHPRDTDDDDNYEWCYWRSEYEVIEPVETTEPKKHKFQVGDKIVGNDGADKHYSITRKGWKGVVTRVSEVRFDAKGIDGSYSGTFTLEYDYFDLADSEESPEPKYKPGDKVKVLKDSCCHRYEIGSVITLKKDNEDYYCGSRKWFVEEGGTWITEDNFKPYEELYNGKVVCVDLQGNNEGGYTVGKIYQFKDGQLTNDRGNKIPGYKPIHNFHEWEEYSSSKFIEVKE